MKLCVIGLGYIGLPTAAIFADAGYDVVGVDKNPKIVDALNRGEVTVSGEEGLADFVAAVVKTGRLKAVSAPVPADVFIITVPTPIGEDKISDMSCVESAARELAPLLRKNNLVVLESTSPVGTTDSVLKPILEELSGLRAGEDFSLGYCPERVIPGRILYELVNNSRVAGGYDERSARRIAELYASFATGEISETDARTAEMCKLSENTYRDVNIAFANELAKICEQLGVNVWELIRLSNKHPRVNILSPGPGVGGHCIAVDPWFIVEKAPDLATIIKDARHINDSMPFYTADRVMEMLEGTAYPRVAILGVTYKPDVDDMRESPILTLMEILKDRNVEVIAHDPFVAGRRKDILSDISEAARGSDLLILGVNHAKYKELDFASLAPLMRTRKFFDTRGAVSPEAAEAAGFTYYFLGGRNDG